MDLNTFESKLKELNNWTDQLMLLVDKSASKENLLSKLNSAGYTCINLNQELSEALLDKPVDKRPVFANQILNEIIKIHETSTIILYNIEILFETSLKIDPLKALKNISRIKKAVSFWPGDVNEEGFFYASPDHPEYRYYNLKTEIIKIIQI